MRLVLDEDLPRDLVPHFEAGGHQVAHVADLGWKGIRNSELLRRISGDYEVLITGDTSLDREAARVGVPRQSLVKLWIAERLERLRTGAA